jgi:hypothetical protein
VPDWSLCRRPFPLKAAGPPTQIPALAPPPTIPPISLPFRTLLPRTATARPSVPLSRAQLAVYGAYNVDSATPASYVAKNKELQSATYQRVAAGFYAVSRTHGADIYYDRCNFPPHTDILNCIHVVYPARERALFDPIVTRISKSLRPG